MHTALSDSLAREHAADIEAAARASRRVREARTARRSARARRRDERGTGNGANHRVGRSHHAAATVGHAAAHPLAVVRHWIAAGAL